MVPNIEWLIRLKKLRGGRNAQTGSEREGQHIVGNGN
jgi:hypothetical protein